MLRMWSINPPALGEESSCELLAAETRCILAIGSALLGYGLPSHRVGEAVTRLSRAFGRTCLVFTLPTFISITLHHRHGHETHQAHAPSATIDLSRLDALHRLVARVERGELSADEADRIVARTLEAPRRYARITELLAVVLVGLGGTLGLGGNLRDAAVGALLGLHVGALLWLGCTRPNLARVLPVLAAVLVTVVSTALARSGVLAHPLVAVIASLFVFVPGLSLTLAMTELATGHLVSGTARMVGAGTVFLQLALGMLLGARLTALDTVVSSPLGTTSLATAVGGSAILALGFAILFSVRRQDALPTTMVSLLAFVVCRLGGAWFGPEIGALLASSAVGVYAHAFARSHDRPSALLTLPGMAILVPGSLGMLSISAAILQDPGRAFTVGFQMVMLMLSLSTGVLLAAAALPPRTEL